jgi:predicted Zn-dependent protease
VFPQTWVGLPRRVYMPSQTLTGKGLATVLALMIAVQPVLLAATTEPQLPDPGKAPLSRQEQEQLGLQAMAQVYKQMPVLPDSNPVTQYVQQLGRKLQSVIPPDRSWPYQFHVIPQKEINAFALPGGPIFINIGTIQAAADEAQLAGVMAHEMSHVYMQHSAKQMSKAMWTDLLAGIAGAVAGNSGVGSLARAGIQFGAGTILMRYSRKDEAQADAVGAIIAYKAGYNPKAMADFFTTLEKKYGSGGLQWLSDHPNPGNRQAAIEKEIQNWPPKNYLASSSTFARARAEANNIKAYSAQEIAQGSKQGIWAQQNRSSGAMPANLPVSAGDDVSNVSLKQVQPSDRFTQAQQSGFTIDYPDNWKTAGDAKSFLIAPQAGAAQSGIAYGAIINAAPNANGDLDEATQQVIRSLQQDNPGMRVTSEIKRVDVNGAEGRSVYLSGNSPAQANGQALAERDWLVTLPHPQGGLMYLVFVAPERDFSQLQPTYQKMLESLRLR